MSYASIPNKLKIIDTLDPGKCHLVETIPPHDTIRWLFAGPGEGETYFGANYITNKRGRNSTVYLHISERDEILCTRKAVQELTGHENPGWHFAQLARTVLKWLNIPCKEIVSGHNFLPIWHYQHCEPCHFDEGAVYDMTAAYWQVASKAKSPLLTIDQQNDTILWQRASPSEEERWEKAKTALFDCKRLRLAIIGVCATGWNTPGELAKVRYFYRGELLEKHFPVGSLQPLAILTVRVAYELTQLQTRQSRSWYSNADCVIVEGRNHPQFWRDLGVLYKCKAYGKLDVCSIGSWSCGDKQTQPYAYSAQHGLYNVHLGQDVKNPVYWEQVYS